MWGCRNSLTFLFVALESHGQLSICFFQPRKPFVRFNSIFHILVILEFQASFVNFSRTSPQEARPWSILSVTAWFTTPPNNTTRDPKSTLMIDVLLESHLSALQYILRPSLVHLQSRPVRYETCNVVEWQSDSKVWKRMSNPP